VPNPQPSWADLNVAPAHRPSKKKIAGIGCLGITLLITVLAIVGTIIGPPKNHSAAAGAVSAAPRVSHTAAPPSPSQTPSHAKVSPSASPKAPAPVASPTKDKPVAKPKIDLVFAGGVTGHATHALGVEPTAQGVHYDYAPPSWGTRCAMPAGDGAWSADVTVGVNGIRWQIEIGESGFGLPKPGSHPALPQTLTGGNADDPNAVSIAVTSDKSPDGQTNAGVGDQFTYYPPQDHNSGAGTVTINLGLTSGTVDIWLTPSEPDSLEFHISGSWSCTG
jgi:hypothetical protein